MLIVNIELKKMQNLLNALQLPSSYFAGGQYVEQVWDGMHVYASDRLRRKHPGPRSPCPGLLSHEFQVRRHVPCLLCVAPTLDGLHSTHAVVTPQGQTRYRQGQRLASSFQTPPPPRTFQNTEFHVCFTCYYG